MIADSPMFGLAHRDHGASHLPWRRLRARLVCNAIFKRCGSLESSIHTLRDLFGQLGLPDDAPSIEVFIAAHRPLPAGVALADASFWTPSQAQFLREKVADDADWAEIVDTLGSLLST